MSKQTKAPLFDPITSAKAIIDKFKDSAGATGIYGEQKLQMLHTVLIVRAIDRLTAAVKDNTKAVRQG
jgi:hypothetical protein